MSQEQHLSHTTKDDVSVVNTVKPPHGKPIITESVQSVDPRDKEHFEKQLFPELMPPEKHLERATQLRQAAEEWRSVNPKKFNDLIGQAKFHEAMAQQPHPLTKEDLRQPSEGV
jgi:hypothetical protein